MGVDQLVTGGDVDDPVVTSLETDKLGNGGAITPTDITSLVGPGIQVNSSGELESDANIPSDVSGSRSFDTWETNNTGNRLFVIVDTSVASGGVTDGDRIELAPHINSTQSDDLFYVEQNSAPFGDHTLRCNVVFMVPAGAEYKVTLQIDDTTSATAKRWREYEVGA